MLSEEQKKTVTEKERLEELSDIARNGIPIDIHDVMAVIEYQEKLREKREKSLWSKLLSAFNT